MYIEMLDIIVCPYCRSGLVLRKARLTEINGHRDILCGNLICFQCGKGYPILDGVAVLVENPFECIQQCMHRIFHQVNHENILPEHLNQLDLSQVSISRNPSSSDYIFSHLFRFLHEHDSASLLESRVLQKIFREYEYSDIHSQTLTALAFNNGCCYLDVGCATGGTSLSIGRQKECVSVGADIAFDLILVANKLARSRDVLKEISNKSLVDFVVTDATKPGLKMGIWDGVVANNLVDVLTRPDAFIQQHIQLTKENGVMVFSSPFEFNLSQKTFLPVEKESYLSWFASKYQEVGCLINVIQKDCPWLLVRGTNFIEVRGSQFFSASKVA